MKGGNGLDEPFGRKSRRSTSAFLPYRAVGIGGGGHCVFKWILRGHFKPTPSATI